MQLENRICSMFFGSFAISQNPAAVCNGRLRNAAVSRRSVAWQLAENLTWRSRLSFPTTVQLQIGNTVLASHSKSAGTASPNSVMRGYGGGAGLFFRGLTMQ